MCTVGACMSVRQRRDTKKRQVEVKERSRDTKRLKHCYGQTERSSEETEENRLYTLLSFFCLV